MSPAMNDQINWQDDESAVQAAVPGVRSEQNFVGKWFIAAPGNGPILSTSAKGNEDNAWKSARKHPTVQAFERAHNPAMNDQYVFQCHAARDGECNWEDCPQEANGRANYQSYCPLAKLDDEEMESRDA